MTHAMALESGQYSQGRFEPITPEEGLSVLVHPVQMEDQSYEMKYAIVVMSQLISNTNKLLACTVVWGGRRLNILTCNVVRGGRRLNVLACNVVWGWTEV